VSEASENVWRVSPSRRRRVAGEARNESADMPRNTIVAFIVTVRHGSDALCARLRIDSMPRGASWRDYA